MTTWVLLRGLAREARHWGNFPAELQRSLPVSDVVVALDLPGNGALWREPSPTTVPGMVEHARRELAGLPHRGPYVLVALSLGGMVALHWAALEKRKVRGCVLINTSLGRFSPFWQRLQPLSYGSLLRILVAGDPVRREHAILGLTSNRSADDATARAWASHATQFPIARANVVRQLAAAARHQAPMDAPAMPTLLLASERDRLVSVRCSQAIAREWALPLALHPDAGHDLPLDDPQWVIEQIVRWSARL